MSLEQLMGFYRDIIEKLTSELLKPDQGRLIDMVRARIDAVRLQCMCHTALDVR
jgi:hypothetical protein